MKTLGIAYVGTLLSFLLIDAIWLGVVARSFYRNQLGDLMLPSPNFAVERPSFICTSPSPSLLWRFALDLRQVHSGLPSGTARSPVWRLTAPIT